MSVEFGRSRSVQSPAKDATGVSHGITRRRFLRGVAAGGIMAALDLWPAVASASPADPVVLRGDHFNLVVERVALNYTGHLAYATAVNGS